MTYPLARVLSATVLGALVTGCVAVPGDPYYDPPRYQTYEQPGYIYSAPPTVYQSAPLYRAPPVVYSPPPPVIYFQGRERDDNRWDHRRDNRDGWRDHNRADNDRGDRDRDARDRARRDQQAREADRRGRDQDNARQEQARRAQADRDRRAADDQRARDNRAPRANPDENRGAPPGWRRNQSPNSFDKP